MMDELANYICGRGLLGTHITCDKENTVRADEPPSALGRRDLGLIDRNRGINHA